MSDKWQMPWALPLGSRGDGCSGAAVRAEPGPERRVGGEGAGAPRRGRHVAGGGPAGGARGRRPGRGSGTGAQTRLADGVMRVRKAKVVQVPRWRR